MDMERMEVQGSVQSSSDDTRTERVRPKTTHVISQGRWANATDVVLGQKICYFLQNFDDTLSYSGAGDCKDTAILFYIQIKRGL